MSAVPLSLVRDWPGGDVTRYAAPTETMFTGDRPDAIRFQRCELHVLDGSDKGSQVSLGQRTIRIGTSPENDLVLLVSPDASCE